ncbi:BamA/TamA family outer membrane protein [Synechococcus sp. HJ21-Hayes]|jgi:outer membrane protein insertion porin family|uniref:BamA/TamA family outer membrane protein n=1 Tax=unclassified Synechococcus TaxID=2626047 RepID=UPI0020CCC3F8|nr:MULTISPECIES: BamA/TamA family outer membrane protein [unclassified Synechococcus]MCP9829890.1 BamA/TamA family outer membrane protein [Synechococcus sp. JJ3a-Johnson]MCP9851551.1 BamA/TamA family outer membrane protein [Synechococcus sp. HJ21-Hayes]
MAGPRNGMNLALRIRGAHGFAAALPLAAAVLGQPVMAQQPVSGQTNAPSRANKAPLPTPIGSDQAPAAAPAPAQAPAPSESLAPEAKAEPRVLISEVVVKGIEGHPERERLELAVYDAMATRPGTRVTRAELQNDLSAIYATGWFSDVRIQPVDSPLGVQVVVTVAPNPVLTKVELDGVGAKTKLPSNLIPDIFAADYGKTLNLNSLQIRIAELQKWYADQGYSLARVTGPTRVSPEGVAQLQVREGTVLGVEVQFLDKEGSATNDKGQPYRGKSKPWVITREISIKPGDTFNRRRLEDDIKRLYGTGLFGDVKVTLRPAAGNPGEVTIVLGVVEQSTGSLSGGLGYSQSQGVFGQVQIQDSNMLGRAWDLALNFTYGQYGGLADLSFTDPWIKGDKYRTAFRARLFLSREVPQIFQSQNNGSIYTVSDVSSGFYSAPSTAIAYQSNSSVQGGPYASPAAAKASNQALGVNNNWFALDGNSIAIQRVGGSIQFVRPLNGGDPFKRAPWAVVVGFNAQEATPMNFSGTAMPYGVSTNNFNNGQTTVSNVICVAYNCQNGATKNPLVGVRVAATMNNLNDPRNPTKGNFLSLGTEQFVSVGPNSPTFNRLRASYTHYIPVNWLKVFKGCRPKPGQAADCKQALAFQASVGGNLGNLPVYEAFCLGGSNSVRGYYDCDLAVGKSFGEATLEYRFPLFSIISGELFVDGGTAFGSQASVTGNPGGLLLKPGQGFSVGTGLIVTTPVGPLRLEVASQDFTGEYRFNLGVGWKF